jgi:hypothetical protein
MGDFQLDLPGAVAKQDNFMSVGIPQAAGLVREASDIECVSMGRGYRFGVDCDGRRVPPRLPKKPGILVTIAWATGMYKYPVRKRLFRSCRRRHSLPGSVDIQSALAATLIADA